METQGSKERTGFLPNEMDFEKVRNASMASPAKMSAAIKADPKAEGVFSRMLSGAGKGIVEGGKSAVHGTVAAFEGAGEFIGVGAAKFIHEGSGSFLDYAVEKTEGIRQVVNIAGDAIAITAFNAVHGDESVIATAVDYWKSKWVDFSKLPAERQTELILNFTTQVAIGVLGSKGLGAVSKTGTAAKTLDMAGSAARMGSEMSASASASAQVLREAGKTSRAAVLEHAGRAASSTAAAVGKWSENVIKFTAKAGVMAAGLDKNAIGKQQPKQAVRALAEAANDEVFAAEKVRAVAGGGTVSSRSERVMSIRPGTPEYEAYRREAAKHGIHVAESPVASWAVKEVPRKPADVVDLAAEGAERSAKKLEWARKLAEGRLLSGDPVFVKRTNGEISVGRVTRIAEDGKIDIAFSGRNGASLHKTVDAMEFRRLNDPEVRLAPEIGHEQLRMRERMAAAAERSGKGVESATSEVFRNASMGSAERVAAAATELGLGRELTGKEANALLKAHAIKADGESAFNFGNKSLGQKLTVLQAEGGFTNEQARTLIRKGYAGEVSVTAERVGEIKGIVKSADYAKQSEFLAKASPKEIGHAFNNGLTDYAAEAFEPEFLQAADRAVSLYEKNVANVAGVSSELGAIADGLPKSVPEEQRNLLRGIIERMSATGAPSFKESFAKAAKASELQGMVNALPASVTRAEGFDALRGSVTRLATNPASQADALRAIDAFVIRFPESAKEAAMLVIEKTDPSLWKSAELFKRDLGLSVSGDEFRPLLKKLAKENPERVTAIATGAASDANFQLRGLQRAAVLEKPFNLNAFRDGFMAAPDLERLSLMLGEHADTRLLDVKEISSRLGSENLDRFFHAGGLERIQKEATTNPALAEKVKRLLEHYGRDASGFTKEFVAAVKE